MINEALIFTIAIVNGTTDIYRKVYSHNLAAPAGE